MQTVTCALVLLSCLLASQAAVQLQGYKERLHAGQIKVYFTKPKSDFIAEAMDSNNVWQPVSYKLESVPGKSDLRMRCGGTFTNAISVTILNSKGELRLVNAANPAEILINVNTAGGSISHSEC